MGLRTTPGNRLRVRTVRLTVTGVVAAVALGVAACAASNPGAASDADPLERAPVRVSELAIDRDAFDLDTPPPRLLEDEDVSVQPLTGEALERASMSFEQVLAQLEVPDYIAESRQADADAAAEPDADTDRDADAEPEDAPAAAVRAYTLGRLAYHDGNRREALSKLEEAHRLDPDSAHILRVLGRMYFSSGNEVRGARRLKDALRIDGDDADSLFLLGRLEAQDGRWAEAVVVLWRSAEVSQDQLDPAVAYLRPFYLGQALFELGYEAAAVAHLRMYLELPQRFGRVTRLHREVAFLDRQRARTHVQIGDALARLGQLDDALEHYEQAAEEGEVDAHLLAARRVYMLMAMGHDQSAQTLLIDVLREETASPRTLQLAAYVAEQSPRRDTFSRRLRQVYLDADRPGRLVVAMAELLPPDHAIELLEEHLEHRPGEVYVFERLLQTGGEEALGRAVGVAVELIRERPDDADAYAQPLLEHADDLSAVLDAVDELGEELAASAAAWYLRGATHESAERIEQALAAYDRALEADETFTSPHLANVDLQIRLGRYEQALELLEGVDERDHARLRLARAQVYAGLERYDDAIDVLDELILQESREVEPRLLLAELQSLQGDHSAAARTLWAILDFAPQQERAYELLFEVHDEDPTTDGSERLRLLRKVREEIPQSRIARLRMVTNWHLPQREFGQAERLLKELVAEDRHDYEALSRLIGVLGHTDQWDEAQQVLVEHMEGLEEGDPEAEVIPLMLLEEVVKHTGDTDTLYTHMEAFLDRQEPTAETYLQMAQLYDAEHLDRPERAIEVLRKALELEPDLDRDIRLFLVHLLHQADRVDEALAELATAIEREAEDAAELYAYKAQLHHEQDRVAEAERMLEAALELEPEHPRANNDLAYYWAEQDRNLERALEMAEIAVEADPENGAYLDTLGWIYYKLGRIEEAVRYLTKARATPLGEDPVILDHLGDALWRAGSEGEAVRMWEQAEREAERMVRDEQTRRSDIQEVKTAAREKIEAAKDEQEPAIAAIPDEPDDGESAQEAADGGTD